MLKTILKRWEKKRTAQGWEGKNIGAGFIAGDIEQIYYSKGNKYLTIRFSWGGVEHVRFSDLNLREIKELLKYLNRK